MEPAKPLQTPDVQISRVKICQDTNGCYSISVQHTGTFELCDYDEIELDVRSSRLVKRK